jgi:hypothetical protein
VTVHVTPTEGGSLSGESRVSVRVDKQRYSAPERQVTTASGALAIYSEHLPTTEGLLASRTEGEHWIPLGRDVLLEQYLLDTIASTTPGAISPSDPPATAPAEAEQTPETS